MQLVEKHIIKKGSDVYSEIDDICFRTKNIYNSSLYTTRQYFFETGKYIGINDLYHTITKLPVWKESDLPARIRKQVIILLDRNFKSFFAALRDFKKNPKKYNSSPRIPRYKDKIDGRYVAIYDKEAISKRIFDKTKTVKLSGANIQFKTRIENFADIRQVRIVPRIDHYVIELVYEKEAKSLKETGLISAIDLGLNNLATVSFNDGKNPFIINGRPLKSINQYYNKKKSELQSILEKVNKKKSSKNINKLTHKRNNKINDYLHKTSRILVNQLVSRDVMTLIIGHNTGIKQEINIGVKNNQNFVQIPHTKFIQMLKYKCQLEGISVLMTEESYTSKCSFLDNEEIKKHEEYKGKRIKRGLFRSASGELINADLNGSYNIMKKVIPNSKIEGIEGFVVIPKKFKSFLKE